MVNRLLPSGPAQRWSFTITDKRRLTGKTSTPWQVQAQVQGRTVRFSVPRDRWQMLEVGRTYTGEVRPGRLGFPFLTEAGLQ